MKENELLLLADNLKPADFKTLCEFWVMLKGQDLTPEEAIGLNHIMSDGIIKAYGAKIKIYKEHACNAENAASVFAYDKSKSKHKNALNYIKRFYEKGFVNWDSYIKEHEVKDAR
jgi:hypothetical protein